MVCLKCRTDVLSCRCSDLVDKLLDLHYGGRVVVMDTLLQVVLRKALAKDAAKRCN
jgi:hypothetical protein